ncbi:hypothetical protein J437_LFUL017482 [Ladona fulva]|uniref:Uncharacterized protein n=1 Tax=Ladona fulva TaxID=123851 RepID=A0A8K0KMP8_LADFU|nr:hypothetical protein J437_LFUL017482 [Ladona fulva]
MGRTCFVASETSSIRPPVKSPAAERIIRRASQALVRERIRHTRRTLDEVAGKLLQLHLRLAMILSPREWDHIDISTIAQAELMSNQVTTRQVKKFKRLCGKRPEVPQLNSDRTVINLTNEDLDEATKSILAKGLNFTATPKRIPYSDFIGDSYLRALQRRSDKKLLGRWRGQTPQNITY